MKGKLFEKLGKIEDEGMLIESISTVTGDSYMKTLVKFTDKMSSDEKIDLLNRQWYALVDPANN